MYAFCSIYSGKSSIDRAWRAAYLVVSKSEAMTNTNIKTRIFRFILFVSAFAFYLALIA
jgi:hypothetical protein